jgi:hypothetical protein
MLGCCEHPRSEVDRSLGVEGNPLAPVFCVWLLDGLYRTLSNRLITLLPRKGVHRISAGMCYFFCEVLPFDPCPLGVISGLGILGP